jgi:hypothetical protein
VSFQFSSALLLQAMELWLYFTHWYGEALLSNSTYFSHFIFLKHQKFLFAVFLYFYMLYGSFVQNVQNIFHKYL